MDIWSTLERAVRLFPDKIGAEAGDRRLTYREIADRARRLAGFLAGQGLAAGDRLAILDDNTLAFLETYYAAAGLGAVLCPLNVRLAAPELAGILRDAGARWLLTRHRYAALVGDVLREETPLEGIVWFEASAPLAAGVASVAGTEALAADPFRPEPVEGGAVAHLYYTSGTTGRPKGVMLTHRNVCVHALGAIAELQLTDADVWGHIAPLFHLADAWAVFAVTWVGGRHVLVPRFEAGAALAAIERHGITITNLIPTMLNLMTKHPDAGRLATRSLRRVLSGGAPIAPDVVRRVVDTFGCDYVQTYGMTETSPYLTLSVLKENLRRLDAESQLRYRAKTGRPFITVALRVVDEEGREVAADDAQVGEIQVRGDTVTPGYWNRPEETRAAFQDGWLKTGDLATVDGEGYVTIVDRKKDMILSGGENVYSIEVENALHRHPAVVEAAVFGVPDPTWGEAVRAAVVLEPGAPVTGAELIAFLKEHLASFKVPRAVDFLDALPRTGSGKICKRAVRDRFWPGSRSRPPTP